jgi:hypothetical protein
MIPERYRVNIPPYHFEVSSAAVDEIAGRTEA